MTENVENILLEHLKRFQTTQDRIEHKLEEHTLRLRHIETTLAKILRELADNEEGYVIQSVRADRLSARIDRMKRRLELRDS